MLHLYTLYRPIVTCIETDDDGWTVKRDGSTDVYLN